MVWPHLVPVLGGGRGAGPGPPLAVHQVGEVDLGGHGVSGRQQPAVAQDPRCLAVCNCLRCNRAPEMLMNLMLDRSISFPPLHCLPWPGLLVAAGAGDGAGGAAQVARAAA